MEEFESYFKDIYQDFKRGETTELTFRTALKVFIEKLIPELKLSEENKNIKKTGRPDFTCLKKELKIGYIETKDIVGINLDEELKSEQLKKYSDAIPNIILTDYTRFILFRNLRPVLDVKLFSSDDLKRGKVTINDEDARKFKQLLDAFVDYRLPTIKTATELASELSKKTKLLREYTKVQLDEDLKNKENGQETTAVFDFYEAFRELVKDAPISDCVDAYAQTITYGLFLAKIGSSEKLTRDHAVSYIPASIKIIKKIFMNITGDALPKDVSWVVDDIIAILNNSDIQKILAEFVFEGKNYKDPLIHFYEGFLKEYDPEKRKQLFYIYTN